MKIEASGKILARVSADDGRKAVIYADAFWVPDLQSENLIPVRALTSCEGCKVVFESERSSSQRGRTSWDGEEPAYEEDSTPEDRAAKSDSDEETDVATAHITCVNGEKLILRSQGREGLHSLDLQPIPRKEAPKWRKIFRQVPGGKHLFALGAKGERPKRESEKARSPRLRVGTRSPAPTRWRRPHRGETLPSPGAPLRPLGRRPGEEISNPSLQARQTPSQEE